MDHKTAADRLVEFLYGELGGDERAAFEGHLGGCDSCRRELDGFRAARDLVRKVPDEEPPQSAHARILEVARAAAAGQGAAAPLKAAAPAQPATAANAAPGLGERVRAWWQKVRTGWQLPTFVAVGAVGVFLLASRTLMKPEVTYQKGDELIGQIQDMARPAASAPVAPPALSAPVAVAAPVPAEGVPTANEKTAEGAVGGAEVGRETEKAAEIGSRSSASARYRTAAPKPIVASPAKEGLRKSADALDDLLESSAARGPRGGLGQGATGAADMDRKLDTDTRLSADPFRGGAGVGHGTLGSGAGRGAAGGGAVSAGKGGGADRGGYTMAEGDSVAGGGEKKKGKPTPEKSQKAEASGADWGALSSKDKAPSGRATAAPAEAPFAAPPPAPRGEQKPAYKQAEANKAPADTARRDATASNLGRGQSNIAQNQKNAPPPAAQQPARVQSKIAAATPSTPAAGAAPPAMRAPAAAAEPMSAPTKSRANEQRQELGKKRSNVADESADAEEEAEPSGPRRKLKQDASSPEILLDRADRAFAEGRFADAKRDYETLVRRFSASPDVDKWRRRIDICTEALAGQR